MKNHLTKKLGEIIELHYGKGIAQYDRKPNGRYPIYGANGEIGRTDKFLVEGDALIIGRKGTAGEVTRVSGRFWPLDVTYYVFGNEKLDVDYLFYALKKLDLKRLVTGVKPGINRNKVYDLEILVPSLPEQKRIVERIEKLFAKIEEAERLRAESLAASAALLPSALHKVFSSAKKGNWPNKKLGEVCDFQGGTQPPKSVFKYEPQKGYVRLLQIRDFVSDAKATYIPDSPKLRKCATDDILIGRYGASVGKILTGKSGAYNVAIIKAIPNENFLSKDYLYLFLQSPDIQKGFTNFSKRAAQAGFTKEELGSFEITLPPLSEQKRIVSYLDALSQKARELQELQQQTAANFSALRQSILAEVFNQK